MLSSYPWLNEWWIKVYFFLLRPMFKWVLRKVTGKCELLRITYGETDKVERTIQIENSLKSSNDEELKRLVTDWNFDVPEMVKKIAVKKDILPEIHVQFEGKLTESLTSLKAYNKILKEAEELRQIKYSSEDKKHEEKLVELWRLWMSEPLPSRVGEHWTHLGFQGNDPQTDFRGMGLLGLEQLIFFAKEYPSASQQVLSHSHHPKLGFSLAIVGINLTQMGHSLLTKRHLRPHFYQMDKAEPNLNDLHQVYCSLLSEFTQFWISENPRDIMEFNRLRNKFNKKVKAQLKLRGPGCLLTSEFQTKDS